ncbi:hypothetical protein ABE85_07705 [Mitsuaria sp. 7]|nr:hypothetical protein ABE85_07705 [Mitsuaria sp. 7]
MLFVDDVRLRTLGADWRGGVDGRERGGSASEWPSCFVAPRDARREPRPPGMMCSLEGGVGWGSAAVDVVGVAGVCGPDSVSADRGGTLIGRAVGMVLLMTP